LRAFAADLATRNDFLTQITLKSAQI